MQSLAMLDAILSPDEVHLRYHFFNWDWDEEEQMGSMDNGCGDDYHALFAPEGCFFKGFAHECLMSPYADEPVALWPDLLTGVPKEFAHCLIEPAFTMQDTTFAFWWLNESPGWKKGPIYFPPEDPDPDGSADLLRLLAGNPLTYKAWAQEYFEVDLDVKDIISVYNHLPLTEALVRRLNPECKLEGLAKDMREIGYPAGRVEHDPMDVKR